MYVGVGYSMCKDVGRIRRRIAPGLERYSINSRPGVEGLFLRRHAELGSAQLVRFFQRALDLWADASDHLDILPAQLIQSTRSHRSARRGPSSSMEQRHFTEEFPGDNTPMRFSSGSTQNEVP